MLIMIPAEASTKKCTRSLHTISYRLNLVFYCFYTHTVPGTSWSIKAYSIVILWDDTQKSKCVRERGKMHPARE